MRLGCRLEGLINKCQKQPATKSSIGIGARTHGLVYSDGRLLRFPESLPITDWGPREDVGILFSRASNTCEAKDPSRKLGVQSDG